MEISVTSIGDKVIDDNSDVQIQNERNAKFQ